MKLTSQSKPLFAPFNPCFFFMPVQKMKIKRKYSSRIVFFFINILKFMDKRTVITVMYLYMHSYREYLQQYTNEQRYNLAINNEKM